MKDMTEPDYQNDPAAEEQWCAETRSRVVAYLSSEGHDHGMVAEWPAWHVAPYVSIWSVESKALPGWVGSWVICGDLPTDVVSAQEIKHPRKAMEAFSKRWLGYVQSVRAGSVPDGIEIGSVKDADDELLPLLESRAETLSEWANDETLWED